MVDCGQFVHTHTRTSVIEQYNLVPGKGRWRSAGWEGSRGPGGKYNDRQPAYRRVYGFGHLRADCTGPQHQLRNLCARFEYGTVPSTRMLRGAVTMTRCNGVPGRWREITGRLSSRTERS